MILDMLNHTLIRYWDTINIPIGDQWAGAGTTHFATAHV